MPLIPLELREASDRWHEHGNEAQYNPKGCTSRQHSVPNPDQMQLSLSLPVSIMRWVTGLPSLSEMEEVEMMCR